MPDFALAQSFITALTGNANTVISWRVIHDTDKGALGKNLRGTLSEQWQNLCDFNASGWGVFCNINEMDGIGSELANVVACRAHVIDLDKAATAAQSYLQAVNSHPAPQFAVQSSPGKFHIYWRVHPYAGNDFYTLQQKKLIQIYNSDHRVTDATRVMRVPGFAHQKAEPFLVGFTTLAAYEKTYGADEFAATLAHINIIEHSSTRSPLGTLEMAAPSLSWLQFALKKMNPNEFDRDEWMVVSAAFKQAGWSLLPEDDLKKLWLEWCAQYEKDDVPVNLKLWNSLRDTEVGWKTLEIRSGVSAYRMFGHKEPPQENEKTASIGVSIGGAADIPNFNKTSPAENLSEILDGHDCKEYFKDCFFINNTGKIFSRAGRFMDSTKFNGSYGGKHFIITSTGKTTDEAWKAALRSTVYQIPKVDHTRFIPDKPLFHQMRDAMGRIGLNTYIPIELDMKQGDVTPFLDHMARILPNEHDRRIFFDYMAHAVKFPGFKIPWAPLLQSTEGVGKTVFFEIMQHALGEMYVYSPKANQLVSSGNVFSAWMRSRLMIIVNEIRIDEKLELIEILKPLISDARIEVQAKGVDQEMEDNAANWIFFTNFRDAIPIKKNGRRWAIFYSALQFASDLIKAGMDDKYFNNLFDWLRNQGGFQAVTYWLHHYPIERGGISMRAPQTTSYKEALRLSRSPMEVIVTDAIEDENSGFRNGYVSAAMVLQRSKLAGLRNVSAKAVSGCLEGMGYYSLGRSVRPYLQEDAASRSEIFSLDPSLPVADYGRAQGYD